jgi:phytoene synthase
VTTEEAYARCRAATRRAGTNFYFGMQLLPRPKRRALWALYAFCRRCDDAVDEHAGAEAARELARAEDLADRAFGGAWAADPDPVVVALGDAIRRFGLPREPFDELLAGMRMDLEGHRYRSFDDLRLYCERVAGTVGLLSVHVFGFRDPRAPDLAVDMGIALQLTNILRDLKEEVARGRVYLPEAEMEAAGYSREDLFALRQTEAFARLMAAQVRRARWYYARARELFPLVAPDARLCPMALHAIYRELLERIEASGYDVFRARPRVPTARKLQLIAGLLLGRGGAAARDA